jgi:hypothetical protein
MYQESFANGEMPSFTPTDLVSDTSSKRSRIAGLLGTGMSLLLLLVAALEYRSLDMATLRQMLPTSPVFWLVFAVCYLTGPIGDWAIYRRLWRIPWSGFAALIRKLVSNELIFGYLGEAQFYAWARARANMTAAPFGAIKDVALLSALVGNVATLLLLAVAWPLITAGAIGIEMRSAFLSLGVVLLTSFAMFLFRQKLFTLPRTELWFIAMVHAIRTSASLVLGAVLWHLALPQIAIGMWLVMSALRMLVSRLPFVPNKDLVFAGLAVFLVGFEPQVGALMTMMAALTLAAHVVVGAGFAIAELARVEAET